MTVTPRIEEDGPVFFHETVAESLSKEVPGNFAALGAAQLKLSSQAKPVDAARIRETLVPNRGKFPGRRRNCGETTVSMPANMLTRRRR